MKKKMLAIVLGLIMLVAFMPSTAFAITGSAIVGCNKSNGLVSIEYWMGSSTEHTTITAKDYNDEYVGSFTIWDVPSGTTVHYILTCNDEYTFGDDTSKQITSQTGTTTWGSSTYYNLTKMPVAPIYTLPEGLSITDQDGNVVPSNGGENWEIRDRGDIVGYALKIYTDDVVISGTYDEAIELYEENATIDNLTIQGYRGIDVKQDESKFTLNVKGTCKLLSINSFSPCMILGGDGTLEMTSINSYGPNQNNIDIQGPDVEITNDHLPLDINGYMILSSGKLHLMLEKETSSASIELDGLVAGTGYDINALSRVSKEWTRGLVKDGVYVIEEKDGTYSVPEELIIDKTKVDEYKAQLETYKAPAKASITVKALGKRSIKISWKKIKGATSYQVYYKRSGKKSHTVSVSSKYIAKTVKKLAKGKKYTVKVRAVKKIANGVIYGNWSSAKTVKAK